MEDMALFGLDHLYSGTFLRKCIGSKILHFDLDCFYAAVEMRDQPHLRTVPLAIGGPPNSRSVLCTANYEARKFGIRSGMSSSEAVRLCSHLVILPPDFSKYKSVSEKVFTIFQNYTEKIEGLSLDEAYLDVTQESKAVFASSLAKDIQKKVLKETELTISCGVSYNKFLAKVASDWRKPNGFYVITPSSAPSFVTQLKIQYLFGIGKKTVARLNEMGIETCLDIQKMSPVRLKSLFGSRYLDIFLMAHGIDTRRVESGHERKSFSNEETFSRDLFDENEQKQGLFRVYKDWRISFFKKERLDCYDVTHLHLKVKYFDHRVVTHERKYCGSLEFNDFELLFDFLKSKCAEPIRLIGVGVRLEKKSSFKQLSFE